MKLAFWLLYNGEPGKAAKSRGKALEIDRPIFTSRKELVGTVKWSEMDQYLTPEFYRQNQLFERWKMGFGMPRGLSWDQQPAFIIDILETLEAEYRKLPAEAK